MLSRFTISQTIGEAYLIKKKEEKETIGEALCIKWVVKAEGDYVVQEGNVRKSWSFCRVEQFLQPVEVVVANSSPYCYVFRLSKVP